MHETLPVVFALVAVFAIAMYVCLDGMDLGVGILYLFAPKDAERDLMMKTLAPVWDGNETWLVLGAMVLFAAFPSALAVLLPTFYLPIMAMLFALVMRGVAFEFRGRAVRSRAAWNITFSVASIVAAACQGLILGTYIQGFPSAAPAGPFYFVSVLSVLTAVGLVGGYALLGATWLVWRTEGSTQVFAREIAQPALIAVGALLLLCSLYTPFVDAAIFKRWFAMPGILLLAPLPAAAVLAWIMCWKTLWGPRDYVPFLLTLAVFLASLVGLCVSLYPFAVPRVMTLWEAASPDATLIFVGIGLMICLPVICGYLIYSYWVFRGKVTAGSLDY